MSEEIPSNSVLAVKLDYIQKDITVIKGDIKEIKTNFIERREFDEALKSIRDTYDPLKRIVYVAATTIGVTLLGAVLSLVIKR